TSLRAVPEESYAAARLGGATEPAISSRIKIPIVAPAPVLTGLFSLIRSLPLYGEPTPLRPLTTVIGQSSAPLMKLYRDAFARDDMWLAAASSVLLAVGTLILSVILLRLTQRSAFGGDG